MSEGHAPSGKNAPAEMYVVTWSGMSKPLSMRGDGAALIFNQDAQAFTLLAEHKEYGLA